MNKIEQLWNGDSDLGKYGRAMLRVELKWLDLLELIKDRCVITLILEHFSGTNHMLNDGKVSQLAWVTPCLDRIRCVSWRSVIGGSSALVLPDYSLIVGCCVCVKGWGINQHLSLAMGMIVGLVLVWVKLYTPVGFLIYCNSRALGYWAHSCTSTLT